MGHQNLGMFETSAKSFTVSVAMDDCCKRILFYSIICLFCCFCLCIQGIHTADGNDSNFPSEIKFLSSIETDNYYQNLEKNKIWEMTKGIRGGIGGMRSLLGGPGSSPPPCTSKCGRCMPCKPVHVAVPPGMRVTTEYYPEAWRCKCGNTLYVP